MKKLLAFVAISTALCLLSACNNKEYECAYNDGYNDGYSCAEFEIGYLAQEKFSDGYEIGFDDGYDNVCGTISDAMDYAREKTGWSVYEAWNNISIYNDGVHPFGYDLPTEEEYRQSIETLVIFCEYLDNEGLGG